MGIEVHSNAISVVNLPGSLCLLATAFCFSQTEFMSFGSAMYGIALPALAELMISWKACSPFFGSPEAISLADLRCPSADCPSRAAAA